MMVTVLYDSEKMNRTKCWAIFFIIWQTSLHYLQRHL
jgi:hypothetical protein